ncbi:MAG: 2'-5' RNA ligase family protein [Patescibacteria group bacterium]
MSYDSVIAQGISIGSISQYFFNQKATHMVKKYFIGFAPTGEAKLAIDRLRHSIAERFGVRGALNAPPHITLQRPFTTSDTELLEKQLAVCIANTAPFAVRLLGFGAFDDRVWFIEPEQSAELYALHAKIADDVLNTVGESDAEDFGKPHFHLTLAFKDVSPENHRLIGEFLRTEPLPLTSLDIDAVTLFVHSPSDVWQEQQIFPLSSQHS